MPSTTVTTATAASATSLTITKPTGLAVGDLMLGYIVCTAGSTFTLTLPSGWSVVLDRSTTGARKFAVFSKVATSGDVAASNFTFANNGVNGAWVGVLVRCTGVASGSEITTSEIDEVFNTASPSYTGASTPATTNSLILMSICGWDTAGLPTVSGYASTPSKTWTELADVSQDLGAVDPFCALASAESGVLTQVTAYSATLSQPKDTVIGTLIIVRPPTNATGTNAVFSVLPTLFNQNGSAGTTGTNNLHISPAPIFPTQSGVATSPTQWQNESNGSTSWINETL